jgi:predicted enzyme related to lactoylglutathione lyase
VHVDDTDATYSAALAAGAESVAEPHDVMPGVRIAVVRAPGGVVFGLSGPTA